MIGREEIQRIKSGAFFTNVSRGPLIDEVALHDALTSGHLSGAGLDVMSPELPNWNAPIPGDRNLVLTPHIGWKSGQSIIEVKRDAVAQARRILFSDTPRLKLNGKR